MSRNKTSKTYTSEKRQGKSKGGYSLNRNGVPLDKNGNNVMKTQVYSFFN